MPSLCCFWCPTPDSSPRSPGETCRSCGRAYDYPLNSPPSKIGTYRIVEPVSRGFYSAVYRARQESLQRMVVLKVVPHRVYQAFEKNWAAECQEHAAVAEGTPYVASITEQFDHEVDFSGSALPCHVAVLENIVGPTLQQLLQLRDHALGNLALTPRVAAQIAIDLFEILHLFPRRGRFHNDLHAGNVIIQKLDGHTLRSGTVHSAVRAVAIDLGSVLDSSRSGTDRLGDQHHIANHLSALAEAVHRRGGLTNDVDNRLAGALRGLAEHLTPAADSQRVMTTDDARGVIQTCIVAVDEPWRQPLALQRFGDAYNAQALESWHVPNLWFDPDDRWFEKTTTRGPQVITGMRGCGKTMLLRALHFHARAVQQSTSAQVVAALTDDFIGVYASCQKLLNPQDHSRSKVSSPFERLFVAYLRDGVQVLRHLRSIAPNTLLASIDLLLRDALQALDLTHETIPETGEHEFEHFLIDLQFRLADGNSRCRLKMAPAEAFGHLAAVIRSSSSVFANKYVLFLLDDVSTRYLPRDMVQDVISCLLFQHPRCAFRITTEAQALHRVLRSPGGSAPADPNRDYEEFNLGNEVYRLLKAGSTTENVEFIAEILRRRGQQFHEELYRRQPVEVLGDVPLEQIARDIASSSASSPGRKKVYRGLRAIQAVCVGDLGDVVKLYERILQRADRNHLPVPAQQQTDCFLEHSASLMHFLNRRDQHKKGLALAFAQAAGELLQHSARKRRATSRLRLRQYTKLYVRVDAGEEYADVANRLLDLLDAGVFVYDGGVPRTKTRDDDPVLQFKLSYRKILGLASFIGLADRDRFELSGETLRQWLAKPEEARGILVSSEARSADDENGLEPVAEMDSASDDDHGLAKVSVDPLVDRPRDRGGERQKKLGGQLLLLPSGTKAADRMVPSLGLRVTPARLEDWRGRSVGAAVIALGFEERTHVSAARLLGSVRPDRVILVEYNSDQGDRVRELLGHLGLSWQVVSTTDDLASAIAAHNRVIVDTSGLSKPFLFVAVRDALRNSAAVGVVHTLAKHYYPRNQDLEQLGFTADATPSAEILGRLQDVLMGEEGPFGLIRVHEASAGPERWRTLLASASPKNDRLLHLLDSRVFDATRILVPTPTTPRRRVAQAAAELAASAAGANVGLVRVDTNDIVGAIEATQRVYSDLYFGCGANVEVGLTGSKIHAVAAAGLAATARVAAAWYVSPRQFDRDRFTQGVANTTCFDLTLVG